MSLTQGIPSYFSAHLDREEALPEVRQGDSLQAVPGDLAVH